MCQYLLYINKKIRDILFRTISKRRLERIEVTTLKSSQLGKQKTKKKQTCLIRFWKVGHAKILIPPTNYHIIIGLAN